jgi:hypothetical protein
MGDADASGESFRALVFAGVAVSRTASLACRVGVQEKPSAPHTRLGYNHLQTSSCKSIGR